MKICIIIHSLGIGGMERVASVLINQFVSYNNVSVDILLIGHKREIKYSLSNKVTIYRPDFIFDNNKRLWHTVKTISFIRSTVKKLKPTTILSFGEIWNNLTCLSLFGLEYPLFVSDRCKPDKSLGRLHNSLRKWLYKRTNGIVAQTNYASHFFKHLTGHSNIKVIGNPIRFIPEDNEALKKNEVLSVGRLIDTKHFDRLIRLFCDIRPEGWILRIVGGDAQKQKNMAKLNKLIKELNASDFVFLEGEQNEIDKYYLQAKIFAFTSSSEGFPNVIGEAMTAGIPVVSYNCNSGPADMISDGKNGYLVDVFDDELFKKQLLQLMKNENIREKFSINAKKTIQAFNKDEISVQFHEFITS